MKNIFHQFHTRAYRIFFLIILLTTPILSVKADGVTCEPGKICNPISVNSLNGFIQKLLEGVIKIGIPVVALAVVYSGFLFVKAQGNSEEIGKAKDALLYTVIGAAILFGSWAIAQLISETVIGISLL